MKRLTQTLAFCLLTVFTAVAQKNYVSEVWVSDLGKHTEGMDGGDKAEKERVVGTPLPDGENGKGKR